MRLFGVGPVIGIDEEESELDAGQNTADHIGVIHEGVVNEQSEHPPLKRRHKVHHEQREGQTLRVASSYHVADGGQRRRAEGHGHHGGQQAQGLLLHVEFAGGSELTQNQRNGDEKSDGENRLPHHGQFPRRVSVENGRVDGEERHAEEIHAGHGRLLDQEAVLEPDGGAESAGDEGRARSVADGALFREGITELRPREELQDAAGRTRQVEDGGQVVQVDHLESR